MPLFSIDFLRGKRHMKCMKPIRRMHRIKKLLFIIGEIRSDKGMGTCVHFPPYCPIKLSYALYHKKGSPQLLISFLFLLFVWK